MVPRYGHSAVERNRVKRRLREIVRLEMLPAVQPVDVVLRAAPRAYERTFVQLREELRKVTRQLSVPTVNEPVVNGPAAREPVPRAEP